MEIEGTAQGRLAVPMPTNTFIIVKYTIMNVYASPDN